MAFQHHLQTTRHELKYVVSEATACSVRRFIRSYLERDEHTRPEHDWGYPVWSLYLDTPTLHLYRQTLEGLKNRFKLRMRFYDASPASPVFLEIKRRVNDVVCKERAAITRQAAADLLSFGARPDPSGLQDPSSNDRGGRALENFCRLRASVAADASLYVSYLREAYVLPDSDDIRVTFDRQVEGSPWLAGEAIQPPPRGLRPRIDGVILELKFTDRFPQWMRDVVQTFNLQRRPVPKYICCVNAVGVGRLRGAPALMGLVR